MGGNCINWKAPRERSSGIGVGFIEIMQATLVSAFRTVMSSRLIDKVLRFVGIARGNARLPALYTSRAVRSRCDNVFEGLEAWRAGRGLSFAI